MGMKERRRVPYVWGILEKLLRNAVFEALKLLVELTLFVQKHIWSRL
jgi:hypothetical protein